METLSVIIEQAPSVGAVIFVVIVFLRHIKASDDANRSTMDSLRAAIEGLTKELSDDRAERGGRR